MQLTKRQRAILDFVTDYIGSRGSPPSIEEIREHFHIASVAAVSKELRVLEKKKEIKGQLCKDTSAEPATNDELTKDLLAFEADHVWISENLETLLDRYADQWIAVKNGEVIASEPDFSGLLRELRDPAHTCVVFITRERMEMVL